MRITKTEIFYINFLLEKTGITAKDCLVQENTVGFLIKKEAMGKAIGSKGIQVKNLSNELRKKIEFLAYNEDIKGFVEDNLSEIKVNEVKVQEKKAVIKIQSNGVDLSKRKNKVTLLKDFIKRINNLNEVKLTK